MKSINKREILLFILIHFKKNKMFKLLNLIILVSVIQCILSIPSVKENVFSLAVSDGKNKRSEFKLKNFRSFKNESEETRGYSFILKIN